LRIRCSSRNKFEADDRRKNGKKGASRQLFVWMSKENSCCFLNIDFFSFQVLLYIFSSFVCFAFDYDPVGIAVIARAESSANNRAQAPVAPLVATIPPVHRLGCP
jgi:hypothetical protein